MGGDSQISYDGPDAGHYCELKCERKERKRELLREEKEKNQMME